MISSMTAFGRFESPTLSWEVRSVNHRFLEVSFRLPEGLRTLEPSLRDVARRALGRGKVDATLRLAEGEVGLSVNINRPNMLRLLATLEQVRRDAPEIGHPDPLELLRWPGVLDTGPTAAAGALEGDVRAGFEAAVAELVADRRREGEGIGSILHAKLQDVEAIVEEIRTLTAAQATLIRDRLRGRIAELVEQVDQGRFEQEVALLAQKADVAEELDRLLLHVEGCRNSLAAEGRQGRRLDFLMQELNREANTVAAKAVPPECVERAVDLKVVIDQMREQVQNVE